METQSEPHVGHDRHHFRKRVWGLMVVLILFSGWFYWSQYRPLNVRTDCALDSSKRALIKDGVASTTNGLDAIRIQNELFDSYYGFCVRSHGLEK